MIGLMRVWRSWSVVGVGAACVPAVAAVVDVSVIRSRRRTGFTMTRSSGSLTRERFFGLERTWVEDEETVESEAEAEGIDEGVEDGLGCGDEDVVVREAEMSIGRFEC